MKKGLLYLSLLLSIGFTSCSDDETKTLAPEEKKVIVNSIKDQVIQSIMPASQRSASLRTAQVMNYEEMAVPGPEGGEITMSGTMSMDMTQDTLYNTRWIMDYSIVDRYKGYKYSYENTKIELNGSLTIKGFYDMTMTSEAISLSPESFLTINGVVNAKTSSGYDGDIDFNIRYSFNADGTGKVTGTVGGEAYNENF